MEEPAPSEYDADTLIDEIDAGTLRPRSHPVTRALFAEFASLNRSQREVIAAYDAGEHLDADAWAKRLWPEIKALPLGQQGGLRLLLGLTQPDSSIDGYMAGYLIEWARQNGLSDREIGKAFEAF